MVPVLVRLADYGEFFATRQRARSIIRERIEVLGRGSLIVLDWTGVEAVTNAFASELAGWLLRTGLKVTSQGMNDEVRETWEEAVRLLSA